MSWPVGTVLICIDARIPEEFRNYIVSGELIEGAYYSVRETFTCPVEGSAVRLNEIVVVTNIYGFELGWSVHRFRKAESDHSEAGIVRQAEPVHA